MSIFIQPNVRTLLYYVMAQAVRPLANSCEHNSYSFQWMIVKPSRIVTHGLSCV